MDYVYEHCNLYKLLQDYQSAYHNGYSCETAIVKLVSNILWAMKNQQVTAVMALDLSVAFDMVDHQILLSVLKHNYGLEDTYITGLNHTCILEVARLALEKNIHWNEIFPSVSLKGPVQEHKPSIYIAAQYKE